MGGRFEEGGYGGCGGWEEGCDAVDVPGVDVEAVRDGCGEWVVGG